MTRLSAGTTVPLWAARAAHGSSRTRSNERDSLGMNDSRGARSQAKFIPDGYLGANDELPLSRQPRLLPEARQELSAHRAWGRVLAVRRIGEILPRCRRGRLR